MMKMKVIMTIIVVDDDYALNLQFLLHRSRSLRWR